MCENHHLTLKTKCYNYICQNTNNTNVRYCRYLEEIFYAFNPGAFYKICKCKIKQTLDISTNEVISLCRTQTDFVFQNNFRPIEPMDLNDVIVTSLTH